MPRDGKRLSCSLQIGKTQPPEPTRVRAVNRGHRNGTWKGEVCVFRLCYDGDTIFIS